MLGIFFAATALIASGFNSLGNWLDDENTRLKAKNAGRKYYYDKRSCMREVDTNKPVYFYTNMDGDYVQTDPRTGTVVRNITQEKNAKREAELKQIALDKGYETYQIGGKFEDHSLDKCKGFRYKDIKTGDIYVIRSIRKSYYYLRVKDGQFIRELERNPSSSYFHSRNNDIDDYNFAENYIKEINKKNMEYFTKNKLHLINYVNKKDKGIIFLLGEEDFYEN